MPFTVKAFFSGDLKKIIDSQIKAIEKAVTAGIKEVGGGHRDELRQQVRTAGLGDKLANAWHSKFFPRKDSIDAAAYIYSKAPKLHLAFTKGVVINSKYGLFLAIPTPSCPKRIGGKRPTPQLYEQTIGPLRFVRRASGPNLLIADNQRERRGKRGGFAPAGEKQIARGRGLVTVVMFILVKQVTLKKRLDFEGSARKWHAELPGIIARNLK